MKNFLLIAGLLVGLVVIYMFVLKPLLAPAAKPKDPLGDALNTGVNTATGVLRKWWDFETDVAKGVLSVPGKVLSVPGKIIDGIGSLFNGNDVNCSVAQNYANAEYCRKRFPNVDRSKIDAPYASKADLDAKFAKDVAANEALAQSIRDAHGPYAPLDPTITWKGTTTFKPTHA